MKSEQYKDKKFAQFYQGLVSGCEEEKALVFAHPNNLSKLDEHTKQINADAVLHALTNGKKRTGVVQQIGGKLK